MTVSEDVLVGELAAAVPASIRVFQRHGLDFCCGGGRSLAELCDDAGLSAADIVHEIETEARTPVVDVRDWTIEPLTHLADHIVTTYHDPLRVELPHLQELAARVTRAHGAKSPVFRSVQTLIDDLSMDLQTHMRKEELVLFPAIRRLEAGQSPGLPLPAPVAAMEDEHEVAGSMLRDLRTLTEDYVPPAWACTTLKALYSGLEGLEASMHIHVHLENNVLFPRAIELAAAR